ncbi:Ig-like domain-containing protein [Microbacterium sp. A84]|uniref:Ig-like domain-containing protein n=1 Tax=Microbacterium sp. A84 TaxID=3450715 RepID=UPI003F42ABD1
MSTEDQSTPPRTRAEARAAREAAAQELPARDAPARDAPAPALAATERTVPAIPEAPADDVFIPALAVPVTEPESRTAEPVSASEQREPSEASERPTAPKDRRFLYTLLAVVGILVVVAGGLSAVSLTQGPRVSQVQVDPNEAIEVSGSRVILTANQSLQEIDEAQVTVEPATPFTLDAAGRSIGIRFTVPLDDATKYTVSVADVTGTGGGPTSNLTTSFTTPTAEIFLLNRTDEDDSIFRADLSGDGVPVFTHPRINDFRATATNLVVAVEDNDGSRILVMNRDGKNVRELTLPGDGYVSSVQVSDRGGLVGYIYTDREISEDSGRASVLVTQSLSSGDEPQIVQVGEEEASIAEWQFVPDSAAVLFIDFAGTLSLDDRAGDAGAQNMGIAMHLLGVSRGTYTAIIEHIDGSIVELKLADGSQTPLAASDPDYGPATTVTPYPGGTLRHVVSRDESGLPTGQAIIRVDDDGVATPLLEVAAGSAILQACASPSGQYAAVTVAPDLIENAYDDLLVSLPKTLQTHLLDLRSGEEMPVLTGFDISWCRMAPGFF